MHIKENLIEILNKNTILEIDERVSIGKNIKLGKNCKRIKFGYGSIIGDDIYIDVPELEIGEYTSIHKNTTIHGYKKCSIGDNCWIGQNCIIDSIGGVEIGNNVGIGAYSQLWSHIKFGDGLEGCRWNKEKKMEIEDDVWIVGHCIVSPIRAKKKSMLMVGGVLTKDMEENSVYAGSPAKNVTDKFGNQFNERSINDKYKMFNELYQEFLNIEKIEEKDFPIKIFKTKKEFEKERLEKRTTYILKERLYIATRSDREFRFMKFLLYDKAKFIRII